MKKQLLTAALFSLAVPFLASAQCPMGVTPATLLSGQTWAFKAQFGSAGAVGRFTVNAGGILSVTETVINPSAWNVINRLAQASGRVTVNPDCGGGSIFVNLNQASWNADFKLIGGATQMIFSSGASGIARRDAPTRCPPGLANPLELLKGAKFDYVLYGGAWESGSFVGSFGNPAAWVGDLLITNRSIGASTTSGRYQIYSDCSGGEIMIMGNQTARQLEFVFSRDDFSEMFLIRDDMGSPQLLLGTATRQ